MQAQTRICGHACAVARPGAAGRQRSSGRRTRPCGPEPPHLSRFGNLITPCDVSLPSTTRPSYLRKCTRIRRPQISICYQRLPQRTLCRPSISRPSTAALAALPPCRLAAAVCRAAAARAAAGRGWLRACIRVPIQHAQATYFPCLGPEPLVQAEEGRGPKGASFRHLLAQPPSRPRRRMLRHPGSPPNPVETTR